MMSMRVPLPAFFLFFFFTGSLFAQKTWTLQDCIDYALKNNIQVKMDELDAGLAQQQYRQGIANMLPGINGSASDNYNYGHTVDPFTNKFITKNTQNSSFGAGSSVVLFNGFRLQNIRRQYRYDFLSSRLNSEKSMNAVALRVASAYMEVLYNMESAGIAERDLDAAVLQRNRTKHLTEAGTLPKGELLSMEAQVASDELRLVDARNQLTLSLLTLSQLLELPSSDGFTIEKPLIPAPAINDSLPVPESIIAIAEKNLPEIKMQEYKVQSAERALAASFGNLAPRLSFTTNFGSGYSKDKTKTTGAVFSHNDTIGYTMTGQDPVLTPRYDLINEPVSFGRQVDDNFSKFYGFSLSVPIFNGWQAKTAVNRSKVQLEDARLALQLSKNQLRKDIMQAYAEAGAASKKYAAAVISTEAQKEAFKYASQKYGEGLIGSVDYAVARNNLAKAESELLKARYEHLFRMKILHYYMGEPLKF